MTQKIKWVTDGESIPPDVIEKLLYNNKSVENFLQTDNKRFIVAGKGIGKTLLLRMKRKMYESDLPSSSSSIFIPSGAPYADSFSESNLLSGIPDNDMKALAEIGTTEYLWETAIMISVLSYSKFKRNKKSQPLFFDFSVYPKWIKGILASNKKWNPCEVLAEIITRTSSISDAVTDIKLCYGDISSLFTAINHRIYCFIDRQDDALYRLKKTSKDKKILEIKELEIDKYSWMSLQGGLLEAAFALNKRNSHIKIFCSIRKEAYNNQILPNSNAITGYVSQIEYSKEDLVEMMNKLSQYYENGKKLSEVIGKEKFKHPKTGRIETIENYIIRHTVYRPRDFVAIISQLDRNGKFDIEEFRAKVNEHSAHNIGETLFLENYLFLNAFKYTPINIFLSYIPYNILDKISLRTACAKFHREDGSCIKSGCNLESTTCQHPFSELFNLGLLGYVNKNDNNKQKFKSPENIEIEINPANLIPDDSYYLIHPCLNDFILKNHPQTSNHNRYIVPFICVEDGVRWTDEETNAFRLFNLLNKKENGERDEIYDKLQKMTLKDRKEKIKKLCTELANKQNVVPEEEKEKEEKKDYISSSKQENGIHVLIASPSDVAIRSELLKEFGTYFEKYQEKQCGKHIVLHGYEELASGLVKRGNVQDKINEIIKKDIDIVIAIFKHKLGSPVSNQKGKQRAESGTVEELLKHKENKTFPMAYFCSESPILDGKNDIKIMTDWQKVLEFKQKLVSIKKNGSVIYFKHYSKDEKEHIFPLLAEDLKNTIIELFK